LFDSAEKLGLLPGKVPTYAQEGKLELLPGKVRNFFPQRERNFSPRRNAKFFLQIFIEKNRAKRGKFFSGK
jgi:hypothetical protein